MKPTRDFLDNCSKVILNIFTTTQLDEQDKIVEISKIMSESARASGEYTPEMIEVYDWTYKLLSKLNAKDFEKILRISEE